MTDQIATASCACGGALSSRHVTRPASPRRPGPARTAVGESGRAVAGRRGAVKHAPAQVSRSPRESQTVHPNPESALGPMRLDAYSSGPGDSSSRTWATPYFGA
jgi:hypothetical protein